MGKLYLTAAFVLAGSSVVAARFITNYLPPFTTTFLSLALASLTAVVFGGRSLYRAVRHLSRKTWAVIGLQALFGSFLFRIFLTIGLCHIGTAEAGVITGATPAITTLLTWVILRERLSVRAAAGVLITFGGIMLVQGFPFAVSLDKLQPLGVILVLAAAACESLFTILSRKLYVDSQLEKQAEPAEPELQPLVHAGLVSIVAMLLCLIPAAAEHSLNAVLTLPFSGWLGLFWYGSMVTIVAFACMFAGAKRCSGYVIAAFAGIIPISSTVLSVVVLREPGNYYQAAGCGMVVLATIVMSRNGRIINKNKEI